MTSPLPTPVPNSAQDKSQVSILKLFAWVTLAGLVFAAFNAQVELFQSGSIRTSNGGNGVRTSHWVFIGLAWIAFLVFHYYERNVAALVIHVVPVLLVGAALGIFANESIVEQLSSRSFFGMSIGILLSTLFCSMVLSILIGVERMVSRAVSNNTKEYQYLLYRIIGGMLLMSFFCAIIPTIQNSFLDAPALMVGALIGFWAGLYQGLASTGWKKMPLMFGVKTRPVITVGFLGGVVVGPLLFMLLNNNIDALVLRYRYSPLVGFPFAFLMFGYLRLFSAKPEAVSSEPA